MISPWYMTNKLLASMPRSWTRILAAKRSLSDDIVPAGTRRSYMLLLLMLKQFSIHQQKQETDDSIQIHAHRITCKYREDESDQPKTGFALWTRRKYSQIDCFTIGPKVISSTASICGESNNDDRGDKNHHPTTTNN